MILRVQKTLSPNDMGDTRSHQAGIHVPKALVHFFPALDESTRNPRASVLLRNERGVVGRCEYIHYNNKVVSDGTRDEYRMTWIRSFLAECGARTGDTIEFSRVGDKEYLVTKVESGTESGSDRVVVDLAGGWKTVRA